MMSKSDVRQKVLKSFECFSNDRRIKEDEYIYKQIISSNFYKESSSLLIYSSQGHEVNTKKILKKALADEKLVYVPMMQKECIGYARIFSIDDLRPGYKGILEPVTNIVTDKLDILILPGVAFDIQGNRIGRGSGHVDRFLNSQKGTKIALCYSFQFFSNLTSVMEEWDVKMDKVFFST